MKKVISLFQRNYDGDRLIRNEIVPGAEWVIDGEGLATRKYDGTCCRWHNVQLWKRYELKAGKTSPVGFEAAQLPDPVTGDTPGWLPVSDGPDDARHREAMTPSWISTAVEGATYELCGPKVQKNPEGFKTHTLVQHGSETLDDAPRTYESLCSYFANKNIEGIVWHHPDGRMVKIKGKDFGLKRK